MASLKSPRIPGILFNKLNTPFIAPKNTDLIRLPMKLAASPKTLKSTPSFFPTKAKVPKTAIIVNIGKFIAIKEAAANAAFTAMNANLAVIVITPRTKLAIGATVVNIIAPKAMTLPTSIVPIITPNPIRIGSKWSSIKSLMVYNTSSNIPSPSVPASATSKKLNNDPTTLLTMS